MSLSQVASEVFAPRLLPLWLIGACAVYTHFRGRVRKRLPQIDHTTLMAPINILLYAASGVPSTPYLSLDEVPELELLRENWELLREEAERLHASGAIKAADGYEDAGFNSFFRRGWKRFYLCWYGAPPASARALCPRTLALLERVPAVRAAMFVRMAPNSRLPSHRDPFAGSLRYHLGLRTPNSGTCWIEVDGEPYTWRDGQDVLFDPTYMHRAWNKTDQERLILFCDVQRPLTNAPARALSELVSRTLMRMTRTANVPGEPIGLINRVFALIYPIRVAGKRLKKFDRRLYYATKYALLLGLASMLLL